MKEYNTDEKSKRLIISFVFSMICLMGIITCIICDIAITGSLTWSLIPVVSVCFVWLLVFPSMVFWKKRTVVSLASLSIFIIPYLYLLNNLIGNKDVFSIGSMIALPSVLFFWIVYGIFKCFKRKPIALGITFLLGIPLVFVINLILYKMIAEPIIDIWDLFSVFILLILAVISFIKK